MPERDLGMNNSILVVENDALLRETISSYLTRKGYFTVAVADGCEGLEALKGLYPAIIVTDYSMPRMNGETFIERVRETDSATPIILLTGELSDDGILDLLRFSRFTALHKPFRPESLLTAIEYVNNFPILPSTVHPRKANRVVIEIPVHIETDDQARTKNLSSNGCFIITHNRFALGTQLEIIFDLPKIIRASGEVVWQRAVDCPRGLIPGIGVRFTNLSEEAMADIKQILMTEFRKKQPTWFSEF